MSCVIQNILTTTGYLDMNGLDYIVSDHRKKIIIKKHFIIVIKPSLSLATNQITRKGLSSRGGRLAEISNIYVTV